MATPVSPICPNLSNFRSLFTTTGCPLKSHHQAPQVPTSPFWTLSLFYFILCYFLSIHLFLLPRQRNPINATPPQPHIYPIMAMIICAGKKSCVACAAAQVLAGATSLLVCATLCFLRGLSCIDVCSQSLGNLHTYLGRNDNRRRTLTYLHLLVHRIPLASHKRSAGHSCWSGAPRLTRRARKSWQIGRWEMGCPAPIPSLH